MEKWYLSLKNPQEKKKIFLSQNGEILDYLITDIRSISTKEVQLSGYDSSGRPKDKKLEWEKFNPEDGSPLYTSTSTKELENSFENLLASESGGEEDVVPGIGVLNNSNSSSAENSSFQTPSQTSTPASSANSKKGKRSKKSLDLSGSTDTVPESPSPAKKVKKRTSKSKPERTSDFDKEQQLKEKFFIDVVKISVDMIEDPPKKWMDRVIMDDHVETLTDSYKKHPLMQASDQLLVAIAPFTKEQYETNPSVLDDKVVQLVGGIHRLHAMRQVDISHAHVTLYGSDTPNHLVSFLADFHNRRNYGSKQKSFMQWVLNYRGYLFRILLDGDDTSDIINDELPAEDTVKIKAWKKYIEEAFLPENKTMSSVDGIIQCAKLPKSVFLLVHRFWQKCTYLKKSPKDILPVNKLGYPLQGFAKDPNPPIKIMRRALAHLEESEDVDASIAKLIEKSKLFKARQQVIQAALVHLDMNSWESAHSRFPQHITEKQMDRLAKNAPMDSKGKSDSTEPPDAWVAWFEKALTWEKTKNFIPDENGSNVFQVKDSFLAASNLSMADLNQTNLTKLQSGINGFQLILIQVAEGFDAEKLSRDVQALKNLNGQQLKSYSFIFLGPQSALDKVPPAIAARKFISIQKLYWNVTKKPFTDKFGFPNTLVPILLASWSKSGKMEQGNANWNPMEFQTNVFTGEYSKELEFPASILKKLFCRLSMEGRWILDTGIDGDSTAAAVQAGRNVLILGDENLTVKKFKQAKTESHNEQL